MNFNSYLRCLVFCFIPNLLPGQVPISFGQTYELYSEALQEDRVFNVLLPTEYADSVHKDYPVVYLLDGAVTEDFFHAAGLLRYLDDHGMMPPTILVGIANLDRKRDFTYPSTDPRDIRDFPTTGGSAKFISFLQQELTAFVDTTFRTTPHRTLVGQSLGGLLATEIVLQHPGTFNDYVIVSPSLWWDSTRLYQQTQQLYDQLDTFPERLFVAVGEEYPVMMAGARRLAHAFRDGEETTDVTFLPLMDEDHNTILHEALYRAFDGWYDPTVLQPYHYANAWNGLNMRSGPSLDSVVIGKLTYGEGFRIISTEDKSVVIDGYAGKWLYIGAELGRGWVFNAYVSPIKGIEAGQRFQEYIADNFMLIDSFRYDYFLGAKAPERFTTLQDYSGNQAVYHISWDGRWIELRIANLTSEQARVTASNLLLAQGIPITNLWDIESEPSLSLWNMNKTMAIGKRINWIRYSEGVLAIGIPLE